MPTGHYENFPVASVLCPKHLRWPITVVYWFARNADDIADEGDARTEERLAALDDIRSHLLLIKDGVRYARMPEALQQLHDVIDEHELPVQLFFDLIDAFKQDCVKETYANYAEVLDYCARSANPVGRILLHLYKRASPQHEAWSDSICSALQLINFWQDVAIDHAKPRRYLPDDELAQFGVTPADLQAMWSSQALTPQFVALMRFQVTRARALMLAGAPLALALPGRIGWELRLVVQGGLRILRKLEKVGYDVYCKRPTLNAFDYVAMLGNALFMGFSKAPVENTHSMGISSGVKP
jgi:squalene synthase HpnC